MRFYVVPLDAQDQELEGPIYVEKLTRRRELDRAGSFKFAASLLLERTRRLLRNERKVAIYATFNDIPRLMGYGIITSREIDPQSGMLVCSGPDLLGELNRKTTGFNLLFTSTAHETIQSLVNTAGWNAEIIGTLPIIPLSFDGESILEAVIKTVETAGAHFRLLADNVRTIEIGYLGDDQDVLLTNVRELTEASVNNPQLFIIQNLRIVNRSEAIANVVIPFGQGTGDVERLTLAHSNRPEVFNRIAPNGERIYYVKSDSSIEELGAEIEITKPFKEVTPPDSSTVSLQIGGNGLCDVALSWMAKNDLPSVSFKASVLQPVGTLRLGAKVHVIYDGIIEDTIGGESLYGLDDFLWITSITENCSNGIVTEVELSTIDKLIPDDIDTLASNIQTSKWSERKSMKQPGSASAGGAGGSILIVTEDDVEQLTQSGIPFHITGGGNVNTEKLPGEAGILISIPAGGITGAELANNAVGSNNIAAGAVDALRLAPGAVTTPKISDNAVTLSKVVKGTTGKVLGWDSNGDPAEVSPGGTVNAADVIYTPVDNTDWNSDADPGDANDALDQLADRVTVIEGANLGDPDYFEQGKLKWNAAGAIMAGIGVADMSIAGFSPVAAASDADGMWLHLTLANGTGTQKLSTTVFTLIARQNNPVFRFKFKSPTSIATNRRIWFGFTSAAFTASATAPGHCAAIRYDTTASDTEWKAVTRDGTTQNVQSLGAIAADTLYILKIRMAGSSIFFSLDDGANEVEVTSNLPGSTQLLGIEYYCCITAVGSPPNWKAGPTECLWTNP